MEIILSVIAIGVALAISLIALKFLFIQAKRLIGWVGPYLVAIIPSAGVYVIGKLLFGVGSYNASGTGIVTMIVVGTVLNLINA